uniref:Uncharacterized protein n=1 Tax=Hemiselmis tepida TaxID=464990 RepID=A0A7S0VXR2_9CRYP|mmetsp:Transcript_30964/g.78438  ORF Transcript_30964/g.78438 Transcript_30964/m.78438 type:complete len:195 (+) Transcript_30964:163-747(+)
MPSSHLRSAVPFALLLGLHLQCVSAFLPVPSAGGGLGVSRRGATQTHDASRRIGSTLQCSSQPEPPSQPPSRVWSQAGAATAVGANLVVVASLVSVKSTGHGLPAGPYGLLGALEGVSYLAAVSLFASSLYTRASSSAPASREGAGWLQDVAEGLSYASVLGGLAVLGLLLLDRGCIPNALPILDYSAYVNVCP